MMSDSATVSVIIPTYNAASTLMQAIDSALKQTHPVLEIWVCDDGSSDDSAELVYALQHPKVKWLDCGRNYGPGMPRNMGAARATGTWLCFLDSDDYWLEDKLEKQLLTLNATGCRMVSSNAIISRNSLLTEEHLLPELPGSVSFEGLLHNNVLVCSSVMVHRDVFFQTKGFPEERALSALADYTCWLQCMMHTNACLLSEPLMVYNDAPAVSIRSYGAQTIWGQRALVFGYVLEILRQGGYSSDKRYTTLRAHWLRAVRKHSGLWTWFLAYLFNNKKGLY